MNWDAIDWAALERMRSAFLEGSAGATDYWTDESDLVSYDQTFAQRIGWKWDYVLLELTRRQWTPPKGELIDWGCGSGIAHRAYLDHFGIDHVTRLHLFDRSARAIEFAHRRARERFPKLTISKSISDSPSVLLLSHVFTELTAAQLEQLTALAGRAQAVIWVEPGTFDASRALVAVREKLRGAFNVIAPCTHQGACGLLDAGNESHWCHHFAEPPPAVFTDANWSRFARLAGIDLRSLPVSFLVLDRRRAPALSNGAVRVIGRPRVYKAHARLLASGSEGVREYEIAKRALPEEFRFLKKEAFDPLQVWEHESGSVTKTKPL